jgi:hypothetical protein
MSKRVIEERHGFAAARRASGGLGGPSRPPITSIALRALGGVGGHIGAPRVSE